MILAYAPRARLVCSLRSSPCWPSRAPCSLFSASTLPPISTCTPSPPDTWSAPLSCNLFRQCCSRCWFQPYDCAVIRFVELIQPASKLCQWARVGSVVHGLSLATITGRWLGETPFVQVSMTWALTCPETVNQRPCMTRDIETWLSDSTVGNNSVVDRRSRRPVLSPLRNNKQQQLNNNNLPQWWQRQPASLLPPLTARRIFPIFYNLWWAGRCPPTKKNCPLSGGDSGRKFRDIVVAYLATSLVNTNEYLGTGRIATDWLFMGDYLMWHCAVLKSAAAVVIPLVLYVLWFSVDRKPPKLPITAGEEFEPHLISIWFFGRTSSPF